LGDDKDIPLASWETDPSQSRLAMIEPKKKKQLPDIRETEFCLLPDGREFDLIRSRGLAVCVSSLGGTESFEVSQIEPDGELLIPEDRPNHSFGTKLAFAGETFPHTGEPFAMVENAIEA
jgi:hypothetical protein